MSAVIRDAGVDAVELSTYGHCDSETYYCVAIQESMARATYECVAFNPIDRAYTQWADRLHRFMELLELPRPDKAMPGWNLTSSFG
jgi:hypothetical protein